MKIFRIFKVNACSSLAFSLTTTKRAGVEAPGAFSCAPRARVTTRPSLPRNGSRISKVKGTDILLAIACVIKLLSFTSIYGPAHKRRSKQFRRNFQRAPNRWVFFYLEDATLILFLVTLRIRGTLSLRLSYCCPWVHLDIPEHTLPDPTKRSTSNFAQSCPIFGMVRKRHLENIPTKARAHLLVCAFAL